MRGRVWDLLSEMHLVDIVIAGSQFRKDVYTCISYLDKIPVKVRRSKFGAPHLLFGLV